MNSVICPSLKDFENKFACLNVWKFVIARHRQAVTNAVEMFALPCLRTVTSPHISHKSV